MVVVGSGSDGGGGGGKTTKGATREASLVERRKDAHWLITIPLTSLTRPAPVYYPSHQRAPSLNGRRRRSLYLLARSPSSAAGVQKGVPDIQSGWPRPHPPDQLARVVLWFGEARWRMPPPPPPPTCSSLNVRDIYNQSISESARASRGPIIADPSAREPRIRLSQSDRSEHSEQNGRADSVLAPLSRAQHVTKIPIVFAGPRRRRRRGPVKSISNWRRPPSGCSRFRRTSKSDSQNQASARLVFSVCIIISIVFICSLGQLDQFG